MHSNFENTIICIGNNKESLASVEEVKKLIKEHETSLWCLVALTHDLGYPIEKTFKANKIMAKMINDFGLLKQNDFSYNFTTVHQTAIKSLLKTLSSAVIFMNGPGHYLCNFSGTALDFAKSFERLDHGIMSAYLLQMHLDYICELMGFTEGLPSSVVDPSNKRAANKVMVITMLNAITAHTNINVYWKRFNQMAPFLLLCDELDEFSRYSHSLTGYEWIRMRCRTEFACTQNSWIINFTLENPKVSDDIEMYFKKKVGKLHNRFELEPERIERIAINCMDIRKAKPIKFYYEKTISNHPRGIVKKTRSKSCYDVQAYLAGTTNI